MGGHGGRWKICMCKFNYTGLSYDYSVDTTCYQQNRPQHEALVCTCRTCASDFWDHLLQYLRGSRWNYMSDGSYLLLKLSLTWGRASVPHAMEIPLVITGHLEFCQHLWNSYNIILHDIRIWMAIIVGCNTMDGRGTGVRYSCMRGAVYQLRVHTHIHCSETWERQLMQSC